MLKSVGKGRQLHIGASCCTTFHSLQFHTHTHTHTHAHTCRDNVRRKSLCDPTTSISYTDQLSRTAGGLDTGQNHSISSPVYHDPTLMNTLQFLGQSTPPVCNHLIQYFRYQVFHTGDRNRTDGLTVTNHYSTSDIKCSTLATETGRTDCLSVTNHYSTSDIKCSILATETGRTV